MQICVLDFESYYSKTYSLSKMTTEEYVNGDEFEVIGFSYKFGDAPTKWVTGSHEALQAELNTIDWKHTALLCHNTFFDASILSLSFNIIPTKYLDTLSMARAVHGISVGGSLAKLVEYYNLGTKGTEVHDAIGKHRVDFTLAEMEAYGQYCNLDVDLTYALFKKLVKHFNMVELELINLTIRMSSIPLLEVDLPVLEQHLYEVKAAKEELLSRLSVDKKEIMSNPKFARLLEDCGAEVPMKVSPATGKLTYAFAKTDDGLKALLDHPNLTVQTLVAVRLGVKSTIEETRTERYMNIAKRMGRLPIPLSYYGAATGRWTACLVADTQLTVYNNYEGVLQKNITDVLLDDLIWDGEEFVSHEGVVFNGYSEVITYDGITGTEDHKVFTENGEVTLLEAMQGQCRISVANSVTKDAVDSSRKYASTY